MDHCCHNRKYVFSVKKCGKTECTICFSPRLPPEIFKQLSYLPDPVADGDHYRSFNEVYGTLTIEKDRPSLKSDTDQGLIVWRGEGMQAPYSLYKRRNAKFRHEIWMARRRLNFWPYKGLFLVSTSISPFVQADIYGACMPSPRLQRVDEPLHRQSESRHSFFSKCPDCKAD